MKWLRYTDRSSEQIVESIKTKIQQGDEGVLSEISDFSPSNPFVKLIEIWGNLTEQIGYYIDNYVIELFLSKARKFSSMVNFAEMFDYRIHCAIPALGKVKFYITSVCPETIIIPEGVIVSTSDGIHFTTLSIGKILPGQLSCYVSAKQWIKAEQINIVSTGIKNMAISMPSDTAEKSVQIFVNGVQFVEVDSLYNKTDQAAMSVGYFEVGLGLSDSIITQVLVDGVNIISESIIYTDPVETATSIAIEINKQTNVFGVIATSNSKMVVLQGTSPGTFLNGKTISVSVVGTIDIKNVSNFSGGSLGVASNCFVFTADKDGSSKVVFGDGINGASPNSGLTITVDSYKSMGVLGNISSNRISIINSEFIKPDGVTLFVKNDSSFQGGKNIENIQSVQKSIPMVLNSRYRTVTKQDYEDVISLVPGVLASRVSYKKDKNLRGYVYPFGGGIASEVFLSYVFENVSSKMAVGYDLDILPAGEVKILISVTAYAKTGYSKSVLKTSLTNAILKVIGWENAIIRETKYISDVYSEMESISGITGTSIDRFVLVPYPEPIELNTSALNWTVEVITVLDVVNKWLIVFVSESVFAVYRDNKYMGSFSTNELIQFDELKFTVNENYQSNKRWQFYTYPDFSKHGGVVSLMENSAIVAYPEDIEVTIVGGM